MTKPYLVIDLKDYVIKEKYSFDWSDFWFDPPKFTSIEDANRNYIPEVKFPKSFTEEEILECINESYMRADEDSYMCDYIQHFHDRFLAILNEVAEDDFSFEYEENYWDSIKLRVFYPIQFVVGEVEIDGDIYSSVEDYLNSKIDFDEVIRRTSKYLERGCYYDSEIFKSTYLDCIKDKISEIKYNKKGEKNGNL